MPDHEEAVREAREEISGWIGDVAGWGHMLDAYESAIRVSERAKYAALVEAVKSEHQFWCGYDDGGSPAHTGDVMECVYETCAALAAL